MEWIKRNVIFVASIAIAVVLMGVAGFLVLSKMQEDTNIQEELNQQVSEAQRLYSSPAFPSDENIEEAKQQHKALKGFREKLEGVFTPAPTFPTMDDQKFKSYLLQTIAVLRKRAEAANVFLPEEFNFTFTAHRDRFQFPTNDINGWLVQLEDIKIICDLLYQSRINALDTLQRVPLSSGVDVGSGEFLGDTVMTNKGGTTFTPYMVGFRCFSAELANVLEAYSRSTNCIIVKAVNVVPSTAPLPVLTPAAPVPAQRRVIYRAPAAAAAPARSSAAEPDMALFGGKGAPQPVAVAAPIAVAPRAVARTAAPTTVTVIKEEPLQVTLMLEIIRLGASQ